MLDFFRSHRSFVAVVFSLVAVSFLFFGAENYLHFFSNKDPVVLEVGQQKVTMSHFDRYRQHEILMMQRLLGHSRDQGFFHSNEFKTYLFYRALNQLLLVDVVRRLDLVVSDDQIRQVLMRSPDFQDELQFSVAKYREYLKQNNRLAVNYESELRDRLLIEALEAPISSNVQSHTTLDIWADYLASVAYVSTAFVDVEPLLDEVVLSPTAVQDYYDQYQADFLVPESVKVKYIVLDRSKWTRGLPVSELEIQEYYKLNMTERFTQAERRQVHQIFFKVLRDVYSSTDDQSVLHTQRETINNILEKIKETPENFIDLAREYSEDLETRNTGGSLGWVTRGLLVPEIEHAVFDLKVGEISDLVESSLGFHILYVTDIEEAYVQPLSEVKVHVVEGLQDQKADLHFSKIIADFYDSVEDNPEELDAIAEEFSLAIDESNWIEKNTMSSDNYLLNNEHFQKEIFQKHYIKNPINIPVMEVSPAVWLTARVDEYRSEMQPSLQDLSETIEMLLKKKKGVALIKSQGPQDTDAWRAPIFVSRYEPRNIDDRILEDLLFLADTHDEYPQISSQTFSNDNRVTFYRVEAVPEDKKAEYSAKYSDARIYWEKLLSGEDTPMQELSWFLLAMKEESHVKTNIERILAAEDLID